MKPVLFNDLRRFSSVHTEYTVNMGRVLSRSPSSFASGSDHMMRLPAAPALLAHYRVCKAKLEITVQ
jgi:hypothetical protein